MIVQWSDLDPIKSDYASSRIGFVTGSFDLLHGGHLDYLEWAWQHCFYLSGTGRHHEHQTIYASSQRAAARYYRPR